MLWIFFFFLMGAMKLFLKWQNLVTKLAVTLDYNLVQYLFYWKWFLQIHQIAKEQRYLWGKKNSVNFVQNATGKEFCPK